MRELIEKLRCFTKERDWEQFHLPKNLVMALSIEVGELMEYFQWSKPEETEINRLNLIEKNGVKNEIGDIVIYIAMLADRLGIDPIKAAHDKIELNRIKYPV